MTIAIAMLAVTPVGGYAQDFSQDSPQLNDGSLRSTTEGRVTGCVHNDTGVALRSARVEAHDLGSGKLIASAYTNENGSFELNGLPQGVYELVALAGVNEAHQQVKLQDGETVVYFRIAVDGADADTL